MIRTAIAAALLLAPFPLLQGCEGECSSLREEARALRDDAAACSAGDTCILVDMYEMAGPNNCLLEFQCSKALNARTDLDAFRRSARGIAGDYSGCSECSIADCFDPASLTVRCDEAAGRCVADPPAP